jgi:hypothetical protein
MVKSRIKQVDEHVNKVCTVSVELCHLPALIFLFFIYFISNQDLQSYELICWRKSCDAH